MKILIAAGGTGGHVYPAIAVAQELKKKNPQVEIIFVGTKKGFESKIVPEHGFALEFMDVGGIHGTTLAKKIKSILLLPGAFLTANHFLKKHKPGAVLGIGGYVSGLLLILSVFKKIPTAILEPNVVAGITNKWLGKFATKIYLAFEESKKYFPSEKCIRTGNPIRNDILKISPPNFSDIRKTIFIFGGSQGARKINQAVMEMVRSNPLFWKNFSFIHQTGPGDVNEVKATYDEFSIQSDVRKYFDQITQAYEKCHFVIARAGSSILEIAAIGRPSILIPYPYAAGHQLYNAQILVKHGGAYLLEDAQCDGEALDKILKPALESENILHSMSVSALKFRNENAASDIANQFLLWVNQ